MFINASPDSRSLDMVDLRYAFNLLSVLNERSHSADVIGDVQKMRIKVWMLGKNSRSHAASVWTALVGRSASSVLYHFLFHCRSSTSTTAQLLCQYICLRRLPAQERRLKRLDKTASLVRLKYVFISDCRWFKRRIATTLFVLIVIRWCLGWYIVVMLLLIGPVRDRRYNTYICRGSDRKMEPHSCWDKITLKNRCGRGSFGAPGTLP